MRILLIALTSLLLVGSDSLADDAARDARRDAIVQAFAATKRGSAASLCCNSNAAGRVFAFLRQFSRGSSPEQQDRLRLIARSFIDGYLAVLIPEVADHIAYRLTDDDAQIFVRELTSEPITDEERRRVAAKLHDACPILVWTADQVLYDWIDGFFERVQPELRDLGMVVEAAPELRDGLFDSIVIAPDETVANCEDMLGG